VEEGRGGAGKTIHTYTANPEFPHRDFIKCGKCNGLRRPFMTVLGGCNFGMNARKILRIISPQLHCLNFGGFKF